MKLLDGNYLFSTPIQAPLRFFGVMTGLMVVLFLAAAFAYWRRSKLVPNNPVGRRFIRRAATAAMYWSGIALFFALMRYGGVDYLAPPIWMYLVILGMIATVAYFVYDWSEKFPLAVWQLQQSHQQRRFRPVVKGRPEPQRVRAKQRGKRSR